MSTVELLPRIDPRQVFLVSGQMLRRKVGGRAGLSPAVSQRVVFAEDGVGAYKLLAVAEPAFQPLGLASLFDYEDAAQRLRAVAEGRCAEWGVVGVIKE